MTENQECILKYLASIYPSWASAYRIMRSLDMHIDSPMDPCRRNTIRVNGAIAPLVRNGLVKKQRMDGSHCGAMFGETRATYTIVECKETFQYFFGDLG